MPDTETFPVFFYTILEIAVVEKKTPITDWDIKLITVSYQVKSTELPFELLSHPIINSTG